MLLSGLGFALMNLFVRLAGPLPTFQKAFFRNILVLVFALLALVRQEEKALQKLNGRKFLLLLLRSMFGTMGLVCNFYAVDRLPISDASVMNKLAPFFTIGASYFLLKERVRREQMISLLIALVGAVFVARPVFSNPQLGAYAIAFLGGASAGIAYAFVRMLAREGVSSHLIILFFSLFSTIAVLPGTLRSFQPMTQAQLLFLILAGGSAALGQYGITLAYSLAPAAEISIYNYSQVIFAAALSLVFLNEWPETLSLLGYLLIFAASFYLFIHNKKAGN